MMKKFLPPERTGGRKLNIRRLVISCILVAALLVSTSIGLSLAKYDSYTASVAPDYYFHTHALQGDTNRWYIFDKVKDGDTVIEMLDGNIKITIPESATGSNIDNADYYAIEIPSNVNLPHYTVNYGTTLSGSNYFQYDYYFRFNLRGFSYSNIGSTLSVGVATDTTRSISIEVKVGDDFEPTTVSPSSYTYDEDNGVIRYSNLNRIYGSSYYIRYKKTSWAAYADTDWYDGPGDYTLTEPEELAGLAQLVNDGTDSFDGCTITLGDDISLYTDEDRLDSAGKEKRPWVPIGNEENPFKGNFDGNGCTISGLNISEYVSQSESKRNTAGLFGMIKGEGAPASVSDLTLEDVDLSTHLGVYTEADSGQSMGALAGYCDNCDISDIHVDQLSVHHTAKYIGGVIGRGIQIGSISDCSVENAVFAPEDSNNIGGIVGIHYGNDADVNISNCYVSADFGGAYASAGGIVGFGNGGAVGVENCYFTGSFDPSESDAYSGGILGIGFSGVDNDYVINNCFADCDADLIGHSYFGYTAYTGEESLATCIANYGNNLYAVNSSWSGGDDSFTWESYAYDAGYTEYCGTVYKSEDCLFSSGTSPSEVYSATAPSIYWDVDTEDDGDGTVSSDAVDDHIIKDNGKTVTLTATADAGFEFDKWVITGDYKESATADLTSATLTITPTSDITVKATFKTESATTYTVTAVSDDETMGTVFGGGTINDGDSATVTATPLVGYHFVRWEIAGEEKSTDSEYTFTPDADVTVTAVFALDD